MLISIIIPFYKGNSYINSTIDSVCQSILYLKKEISDCDCEIIVVNDSPQERVNLSDKSFPCQINIIRHDENKGIHHARVTGLKSSKGKYILFLDQDDEIAEKCLLSHINNINDNYVSVSNAFLENKDKSRTLLYKSKRHFEIINKKLAYIISHNQIISPGQCLIMKSAIPNQWIETKTIINGSDDLFLWLLMLSKGIKFKINGDVLYIHKHTGNNLSESEEKMVKSSMEILDYLQKYNAVTDKESKLFVKAREFNMLISKGKGSKIKACIKMPNIFLYRLWKRKDRLIKGYGLSKIN